MAAQINTLHGYRFPWREGNRFKFLIDSTEFFPNMLEAIDSAQQYVLLEMYLVESSDVLERFMRSLLAVAEKGIKVYLLFDDYGSIGLKQRERKQLIHHNINIVYYNPLRSHSTLYNLYRIFWRHKYRALYRNHRKLLLVDEKIAFVGGTGLTDEFDPTHDPEKRWRETMIEIMGPVIIDWQQLFMESWNNYASEPLVLPTIVPESFSNGQLGRTTVNEASRWSGIQRTLIKRIHNAEHQIWFAIAYFVPIWRIRKKLARAAKAGVDVRLLLPGPITDHPGVRYASHRYYTKLLNNGVRIFEFQPRFFHTKTVLCDNWVTIGSSNFDRWNFQWNLEANQEVEDQNIADEVKQMFENDFKDSREVTYNEWCRRNIRLRILQWFWQKIELISMKITHRNRS